MQTSSDHKDAFGARLKSERERLGFTQDEFGAGGGVTRLTQSKYEKGESSPPVTYLQSIEGMGVDLGYLFTGTKPLYKIMSDAISEQAKLASEIVEALENEIEARGKTFDPHKKGILVAALYRSSRPNSPVDKRLVSDLLDLASE